MTDRDQILKQMLKTPWTPHKVIRSRIKTEKIINEPRLGFVKEHGSKRRPVEANKRL